MKKHRVDQIINKKSYQGGRHWNNMADAVREAKKRKIADRQTGEYRTSYEVVTVQA